MVEFVHTHYIYRGWAQVIPSVILNNIKLPNNLLLTSYFENSTIRLYVLYVLNMYTNFRINWI